MSNNAIKCPWNKYILLPEGAMVYAGTDCICPAACPNNKASKQHCFYAIFTAKKDAAALPDACVQSYSYTPDEIAKQFPDYVEEARETTQTVSPQPIGGAAQPIQTFGSYVLPVFGSADAQSDATTEQPRRVKDKDAVLTPQKEYDSFELRGVYYTLDGRGGTQNLKDLACAECFYRKILSTFDVESVLDGDDFKDNFIWVLNNTLLGIKRARTIQVLTENNLERDEKFFLLFYYALFFDKPLPLFWANGFTSNLQPIYVNSMDFYRKIASAKDFGFYDNHALLTLLWLKKIELIDWTDDEKIRAAICKIQEEVAVDPTSTAIVFWSSTGRFVSLGRKDLFVKNLTSSDKTLEELEYTVEFLSRFDIVPQGKLLYRVVQRRTVRAVDIEIVSDECNDDIMSMLFTQNRSLEKLQSYLYIIKRYCELFQPLLVKIGPITFDEALYTEQTEELVMTMLAYMFGDAATDAQKRTAHNHAVLAKLLYTHSVLFDKSARAARNVTYMDRILSLVSNDPYAESLVQKCFEICRQNGIADKIKLYSYDYSAVPRKEKLLSLQDWMCQTVRGAMSASNLCARLQDPIFLAYKEVFGVGEKYQGESDKLFEFYKQQETKVLNMLEKFE